MVQFINTIQNNIIYESVIMNNVFLRPKFFGFHSQVFKNADRPFLCLPCNLQFFNRRESN